MKRAIRRNVISYIIFGVIGVVFITYLIITQKLTGYNFFNFSKHLLAFLVSLANAWGIFLIIFMLGYGLVAVPKEVLKLADYDNRLLYLQWRAAECKETLQDRNDEFKQYAQVRFFLV
jgi:hypothetical protein